MDFQIIPKNIECCSFELYWRKKTQDKDTNISYEYELKQKEKGGNYEIIYNGKESFFEVINLKPESTYNFQLIIFKNNSKIESVETIVETLKSPSAILSEDSFEIAENNEKRQTIALSESFEDIINNCSKLIFEEKNENIIIDHFDEIEIKLTTLIENQKWVYYISFDINSDNKFIKFFKDFINEWENNLISPCHFLLQKLPTILIFNLLEKGPIILTGKRMGGVIASSLAFYILLIGQSKNKNYGNSFSKKEKNCIGVVTFGSPSFLTSWTAGFKMKEFTSYFYNIKEENDFIPEIIDFMNLNHRNFDELSLIFNKMKLSKIDKEKLMLYCKKNGFTYNKLIQNIKTFMKIPFGYYFEMNASNNSLTFINERTFDEFYYFRPFHSSDLLSQSDLIKYKSLFSKNNFHRENLAFLTDKNTQLEFIKIIRRYNDEESQEAMNGIIKFELNKVEQNIILPDIIDKIKLGYNRGEYIINKEDIYYDNNFVIANINNSDILKENINEFIIIYNFGGEIRANNIINIQGSGSTRIMLINNIEKLFIFPFFKLIEIFNASLNNKEEYEKLKKQNFGNNFENLNILKPFEKQIQAINELLFLSRPDIFAKNEKGFMSIINRYIKKKVTTIQNIYQNDEEIQNMEKNLTSIQKDYFNENLLKSYYVQAELLQLEQNINCLDSEENSIAKKLQFPKVFKEKKDIKKLYMCKREYFNHENFFFEKFKDIYIKYFFIESLIQRALEYAEKNIQMNLNDKNNDEIMFLNKNIGTLCNEIIIPNIYFIWVLILTSIESNEEIKFNHQLDKNKVSFFLKKFFIWLKPYGKNRAKYEKDLKKNYSKLEIEQINMGNLFNKIKIKDIIDSNNSSISNQNKIFNYNDSIQKLNLGEDYYKNFLGLLNLYSNDFQEDIEISIYNNLKEDNKERDNNFSVLKEMMNEIIDEKESKKEFLALIRQSYLLGKLRNYIVSNYIFFNNYYFIGR